jgi:DNA segregation ATPase FtsK/SpoIIIE-like protein
VTLINKPARANSSSGSASSGRAPFTKFTDPYISNVGVTSPLASPETSYFDWNGALDHLDESEFGLLMRTVELVVQAQTYSRERLQLAIRITPEQAVRMTRSLELLGVISAGEPDAQRRVLVSVRTLPVLLAKLLSGRDHLPGLVSPQELRAAS